MQKIPVTPIKHSIFEHIRQHILDRAGIIGLQNYFKTEWSEQFEFLMRNRLVMGAFRYGPIGRPGKPIYNRINAARARLNKYEDTGNVELLVDVANFMLMEFVEGTHPNKHFMADCGEEGKMEHE